MPSNDPTITELLKVAGDSVHGGADKTADYVRGSDYESLAGPTAIIWSRQAQRDTDLFRATRFNDADGDDLTELVKGRYGIDRILDTHGQGVATFQRPAGGSSGTIWKGTRVALLGGPAGIAGYYRVAADTLVLSSTTTTFVPIEAVLVGPGSRISAPAAMLRLEDLLWDNTWKVTSLVCEDGTSYEDATSFRARVREERRNKRVGHEKAFIDTLAAAGASNIVIFRADYGGDASDAGLNVCYVGDAGYTGTEDLVRACKVAVQEVRVLGDYLQVFPMVRQELNIDADITLSDGPAVFDVTRLKQIHSTAIAQYVGAGRFSYSIAGLTGAIARPSPIVQEVSFVTPTTDAGILNQTTFTGGTPPVTVINKNFPASLKRYVLGSITLRYHAP